MKHLIAFTLLALFIAACAPVAPVGAIPTPVEITAEVSTVVPETPGPPPTEGPSPTPAPATLIPTLPSSRFSPTELKYKVLEQFPDFFFCDPDFYPIAREDELVLAQQRFLDLQAHAEEFQAILSHNNLIGLTSFSDEQKLLIYREHKKLNAIFFEVGNDVYQFQIQTGAEGQQGLLIMGSIDATGSINVLKQESMFPSCPLCLAAGTLIDTPSGTVAVENLHISDPVWTMNAAGERVPGTVLQLGRVRVPSNHQVIHMMLSDGRELWASPGHPTPNGKRLSDVRLNDPFDGAWAVLVERLPYTGAFTYDLLPSGDTGYYWANHILLESTLSDR